LDAIISIDIIKVFDIVIIRNEEDNATDECKIYAHSTTDSSYINALYAMPLLMYAYR